VTTYDDLISKASHGHAKRERRTRGRLGVAGSLLVGFVLCSCAPTDSDSFPPRPASVSVAEHWATLLQIEDSLQRTAALAQFVTTLVPEDSEALEQLATRLYRHHRAIDDLILMNAWSHFDPEGAFAIAMASDSGRGEVAREDALLEWATRDPLAVIAAVPPEDPEIRRAIVRGWYESGVPGLADAVFSSGASRAGQNFVAGYAFELGFDKGATGIAEWLDSVRGQKGLGELMTMHAHRKGISAMAIYDVEAAIAYCDTHCDEPYAEVSRVRLADRLSFLGEFERAILWLESAVDANQQERGLSARIVHRNWIRNDPLAALAWADDGLGKYKDESWFAPLSHTVLNLYSRRDPVVALKWVETYTEEQDREDAMIKIARRWREMDEAAVEVWLESSPLSAEARAKARTPQTYKNISSSPSSKQPGKLADPRPKLADPLTDP
jgi:hypothetical protein